MPAMKWPATCRTITQSYGNRSARYVSGRHTGLDIGCRAGSPIYAAHDGKVTFSGWNGPYGNEVRVAYSGSFLTSYHHMSRIKARKGQYVSAGTVIGYIGSTGMSTGPHLHFEVRVNGKHTDPMPYLKGAKTPGEGGVIQAGNPLVPDAVESILNLIKSSVGIFEWLGDSKNWYRVGLVLGGAFLLLLALIGLAKTKALGALATDAVKKVGKGVTKNAKT